MQSGLLLPAGPWPAPNGLHEGYEVNGINLKDHKCRQCSAVGTEHRAAMRMGASGSQAAAKACTEGLWLQAAVS